MSLTQQIKSDLLTSRKEKNELKSNILRVLLGEIELESCKTGVELPDEKVHSIIRKIIESNNICIDKITAPFTTSNPLIYENEILFLYLPTLLTHDEILALISPELQAEIIAGDEKSSGKFIGKILKIVKDKGLSSNGNDVGNTIKYIKSGKLP